MEFVYVEAPLPSWQDRSKEHMDVYSILFLR